MDVPQISLVCAEINFNTLPLGQIERSDFYSRQYIYLLPTNYNYQTKKPLKGGPMLRKERQEVTN
jgi:hypothetical protein